MLDLILDQFDFFALLCLNPFHRLKSSKELLIKILFQRFSLKILPLL
jgi:hypothetical protein